MFKLKPIVVLIAVAISNFANANSAKIVNPNNHHAYQRFDGAIRADLVEPTAL